MTKQPTRQDIIKILKQKGYHRLEPIHGAKRFTIGGKDAKVVATGAGTLQVTIGTYMKKKYTIDISTLNQ